MATVCQILFLQLSEADHDFKQFATRFGVDEGTVAKGSQNVKNAITETHETIETFRVYGRASGRLQCLFPGKYFQSDCVSHRLRWFVALVVSHVLLALLLAPRMSFIGKQITKQQHVRTEITFPSKAQHIYPDNFSPLVQPNNTSSLQKNI